jgi:6-phospho-3-hexuloisomerase
MSDIDSQQVRSAVERVLAEITNCAHQVSDNSLARAGGLISAAPRIFVGGAGRSGLCMRAFAIRLMHLGKTVYVVGETTTPSIRSKDLLILGSGSGQSPVLLKIAEMAHEQGASILLFTAEARSSLSEMADQRVIIPAPSFKPLEDGRNRLSAQPMGSLFEQSLLLVGDSLVLALMDHVDVGESKMRKVHANLE